MAIFNSYVKLPGGISLKHGGNAEARPRPSLWHTNRGTVAPQSQRACHCGPCQTLDRRRDIALGDAMGFTLKTSLGTQSLGFSTFPWVTFGYWWIYIYIILYYIYGIYRIIYWWISILSCLHRHHSRQIESNWEYVDTNLSLGVLQVSQISRFHVTVAMSFQLPSNLLKAAAIILSSLSSCISRMSSPFCACKMCPGWTRDLKWYLVFREDYMYIYIHLQ